MFYLFAGKLVNERVSAVERMSEYNRIAIQEEETASTTKICTNQQKFAHIECEEQVEK